ncbi:hypothetical protein AYY16_11485 [Morganella psychrotolerans]|nr:hypothetical protein AYY16_11485 [Morganella psychrotolerans]
MREASRTPDNINRAIPGDQLLLPARTFAGAETHIATAGQRRFFQFDLHQLTLVNLLILQ